MKSKWMDLGLGLAAAVLIVVALAPLASDHPDTLERTLEQLQPGTGPTPPLPAPLSDYAVPGVASPWWSRVLAGLAGVLAVVLLVRLVIRPTRRHAASAASPQDVGAARED